MPLTYQLSFYKISLLKIKSILQVLIISIGISSSVSAQSLDGYCLSTVGKVETKNKTPVEDPTQQLPPFIRSVKHLPELYEKPCTKFYRFFWVSCDRETFFSYSPTLNRAFIQGHRQTDWGGDFAHLEISESKTEFVPESLIHSGFVEDIPALNGVLFIGRLKGEAFFYNGNEVTNLSNYFLKFNRGKQSRRWYPIQTSDKRVFWAVDFVRTKAYPFIMELKPGLKLKFIPVPKELKNIQINLFTLQKDSRLWGMAGRNILVEIEGELQNIIVTPSLPDISGPFNLKRLADGSVSFQVENTSTKSTKSYFLRQASSTANCEIMLDVNKPVLLEP